MIKPKIVLATHNLHKRDELVAMLGDVFEVESLPTDFPEIEETGLTLEENAAIKAHTVFRVFSKPVLSDDTGLEVATLGGAPGVYSARYAGEKATYSDNCDKLLSALEGKEHREASFRTVLVYIDQYGNTWEFEGKVDGVISSHSSGTKGFGYDPIFAPVGYGGRTFSEMSLEEKNLISHRGRAVQSFCTWIRNRMNS